MEVEKAFKRLLIKSPFYGLFCLSLPKVVTRKVPTLCVSKQGISCQLNINPDFWEQYTDDEQIALLQHELGHICFQHMFLHDSFADQKQFNISADCEVNSYIENLPKDGCTPDWLGQKIGKQLDKGLGTKKYYEAIQDYLNQQQQQANAQNPQMPCNGGMGGNGSQSSQQNSQNSQDNSQNSSQNSQESPQSSSSPSEATRDSSPQKNEEQPSSPQEKPQSQPDTQEEEDNSQEQTQGQQGRGENEEGGSQEEQESQYPDGFAEVFNSFDDHSTWKGFDDIPEATKQLMQNNINTILKNTAEQVEKMRGTIPGEFSELIEKLRQKKPEVFNWKAYFRRLLGSIYDVNIRSTRRKESKRFAEAAGIQHKKKVSILVAIDTSGSVSQKELQEFFSEIDYAYKAGARITILQCDTRINGIEDYDGKNIPEIKGRGGTDFNPPVDYYVKHKKEYASLIYFTDGEAPLPTKHPQGLVWVISSMGCHQDYPGKSIYIPREENNNN
jgi:predicted metal-dependent peptidase